MEDGITDAYASIVEMYGNVSGELALARKRVNELAAEVSNLSEHNKRLKDIAERRQFRIDVLEEVVTELSRIITENTDFSLKDIEDLELEVRRRFEEGEEE